MPEDALVMPPVENAAAVTRNPLIAARNGSTPTASNGTRHTSVPTTTMMAASFKMNWDVCLMLGMT